MISKTLGMLGATENKQKLINESMKHWNTELIGEKQKLGRVNIRCGTFKGDKLSQLLFE